MSATGEVQISAEALRHNVAALKSLNTEGARVAAVVKGNAYGHGLEAIVKALDGQVDAFQVDDTQELADLREITNARAFVFGFVPKSEVGDVLKLGGEPCVFDVERLDAIEEAGRAIGTKPKVHLKIDALLGRLGVLPRELPRLLDDLKQRPGIEVVSAYAHYANIEDTTDPGHAEAQEKVFAECFFQIQRIFPDCGRHLSATSGLMARKGEAGRNDWVRVGIGIYGLYPSRPLASSLSTLNLRPAMRWVSCLAQVKTVPKGHPVGYGLTYVAAKEMTIGVVPQGYADGYPRALSGSGEILVRGARCPVIGRVAMNMFMVDLSNISDPRPEEEVVLLGQQGEARVTAEEIAERCGTINYEVVARVSPLLNRVDSD
jgi:alanine racemase